VYNGSGDRIKSILDGTSTTYALDLNSGLTQVLADGSNTYLYGYTRIAQASNDAAGYFLGDALGSVRQVIDPEAEIVLMQSYSPYGETTVSFGEFKTVYNYTGEMIDESGLINLRARMYDPGSGRFLTMDSWSGDYQNPITLVKWVYANSNPVRYSDPSGLSSSFSFGQFSAYLDSALSNVCTYDHFGGGFLLPGIPYPEHAGTLHLSPQGETFIKDRELLRVWPYDDTTGTCTIGYGTTLSYPSIANCSKDSVLALKDYYVRDKATSTLSKMDPTFGLDDLYIEEYFHKEISQDEGAINQSITVALSQNQFDALVSYLYNTGASKLSNSRKVNGVLTTYANLINNYKFKEAWDAILFNSSYSISGIYYPILYSRRYEEMEMYFYNDYTFDPENNIPFDKYFESYSN
jgi:RHS repeat-associated protein